MTKKKLTRRKKRRIRVNIGHKGRVVEEIRPWLKEMELMGFHSVTFEKARNQQVALVWANNADDVANKKALLSIARHKKSPKKRWRVSVSSRSPQPSWMGYSGGEQEAFYFIVDHALLCMKKWVMDGELSERGLIYKTRKTTW